MTKKKKITDELTTAMHEDFIGGEIPHIDVQVMAVYGSMRKGLSKKEALAKYELSESDYDRNIERVLKS